MQDIEFNYISNLLLQRSGLVVTKEKIYLLESRLAPIARKEGYADVEALIQELRLRPNEKLIVTVTEAMTTNESFFFRDKVPFEVLKEHVVPHIKENRSPVHKLRIWCAAASSGQEPYTICMVLKENPILPPSMELI